ncbi:MAG: hypothetical protein U1F43_36940 [Myxococcota bacterium]
MKRATTSSLVLLCLAACGDDGAIHRDATDAADVPDAPDIIDGADASDAADAVDASDASDTADASDAADAADTTGDVPDAEPVACGDGFACNADLLDDGRCPGACFAVPDQLDCAAGEVAHGVCRVGLEPEPAPVEVDLGDYRVTPIDWPSDVSVGDTFAIHLRLTNDTGTRLDIPFFFRDPGILSFTDASWVGHDVLTVPAHGTLEVTATATALQPTILSQASIVGSFQLGNEDNYDLHVTVHYPDSEAIACGGEHFPDLYCPDPDTCYLSNNHYTSAECCGDVFFPGAMCCSDADCTGGACVDGKCVYDVPAFVAANTMPIGNQRILLVLVDSHPEFADDPCADRAAAMREPLQLDLVGDWYDDVAVRRFGHPTMQMRWIVRGGVATTDFLQPGDGNDFGTFSTRLDAWMSERGCPVLGAYDKVIISASTVNLLGFGGVYFDHGNIGIGSPDLPYLFTHELGHSFGANDLYLDLGGVFHYILDLMGNNVGGGTYPTDGVLWGEVGYSDRDRDGVIDLVDFAAFPESLAVADLTATVTRKGALEIAWRFVGTESGVARKVIVDDFHAVIPAAHYDADNYMPGTGKHLSFDSTQVDLPGLQAAGSIDVSLRAELRTTDRNWQQVTHTFDQTISVPLTIEE